MTWPCRAAAFVEGPADDTLPVPAGNADALGDKVKAGALRVPARDGNMPYAAGSPPACSLMNIVSRPETDSSAAVTDQLPLVSVVITNHNYARVLGDVKAKLESSEASR